MPDRANNFFLRGNPHTMRLQLIEVTHPAWINTHRYVQNLVEGGRFWHAVSGSETNEYAWHDYTYTPIGIKKSKSDDSLDQSITITVGDLGEKLPDDMDALRRHSAYSAVRPVLNYREYLSDNMADPLVSVEGLTVEDYQPHIEGGLFICKAKELNLTATGISFTVDSFPGLRDFI